MVHGNKFLFDAYISLFKQPRQTDCQHQIDQPLTTTVDEDKHESEDVCQHLTDHPSTTEVAED